MPCADRRSGADFAYSMCLPVRPLAAELRHKILEILAFQDVEIMIPGRTRSREASPRGFDRFDAIRRKALAASDQQFVRIDAGQAERAERIRCEMSPIACYDSDSSRVNCRRDHVSIAGVMKHDVSNPMLIVAHHCIRQGAIHGGATPFASIQLIRKLFCDVVEPLILNGFGPSCQNQTPDRHERQDVTDMEREKNIRVVNDDRRIRSHALRPSRRSAG